MLFYLSGPTPHLLAEAFTCGWVLASNIYIYVNLNQVNSRLGVPDVSRLLSLKKFYYVLFLILVYWSGPILFLLSLFCRRAPWLCEWYTLLSHTYYINLMKAGCQVLRVFSHPKQAKQFAFFCVCYIICISRK